MDSSMRKYLAEAIGTFVLVFFGVGTAIFTMGAWAGVDYVAIALAFGLSVVVMSVTIGRISGCHLNPAISLAMFLDKKLEQKDFIGYVVGQIIGAVVAGLILLLLAYSVFDAPSWGDFLDAGPWGANGTEKVFPALIAEIIMTFFFVLVVFGATAKDGMDKFAGLYIGLALTMVHLVGIGITGTSVNPARSIGMALFQPDAWGDLWIFIVAPLIGGVLAWLVWSKVLRDESE
jgi:aquaporin Z